MPVELKFVGENCFKRQYVENASFTLNNKTCITNLADTESPFKERERATISKKKKKKKYILLANLSSDLKNIFMF